MSEQTETDQPPLLPDRAFDFYEIAMWSDLSYRLRRTHIQGSGTNVREVHHYQARGAGGEATWVGSPMLAEPHTSAQAAALALIWSLNQHGVIG